jgi:tubulin monoglycylase TTLL3/8
MANKLSYSDLNKYISGLDPSVSFYGCIYPKMKAQALDCIKATYNKLIEPGKPNSFEIFGLDFMIDENYKLFLIEINTNPCLELSSPLLGRIIP